MTWAEEFSHGYDSSTAGVTEDIDFYVGLAVEAGGPVVELAIGSGRVAVPIALATGAQVIGVDTSPAMLEQARRRADEAGVELLLHLGDMVDLQLDDPANLIICPFRALLHVPTWAARRRLFERVAASLRPGGRFAWNAFAFDHHFAARVGGIPVVDSGFAHTDHFVIGDNRVDIILDSGARSSLWWATKNEWLGLIDVAGLELEALYGGFDRTLSTKAAASTSSSPVAPPRDLAGHQARTTNLKPALPPGAGVTERWRYPRVQLGSDRLPAAFDRLQRRKSTSGPASQSRQLGHHQTPSAARDWP